MKRSKREQILIHAQEVKLPLKVRLPESFASAGMTLDPSMPAKKQPAFAELAGNYMAQAYKELDPRNPLKKQIPEFLVDACLPAAPR